MHSHCRDVDPQIAGDGDERNLTFLWPDDGNDQCVSAVGGAWAFVGADEQEVDRFVIGEGRQGGGCDGYYFNHGRGSNCGEKLVEIHCGR